MWLLGRLYPDHKSIAEFRRIHRDPVTAAGAELVGFAKSCYASALLHYKRKCWPFSPFRLSGSTGFKSNERFEFRQFNATQRLFSPYSGIQVPRGTSPSNAKAMAQHSVSLDYGLSGI
jgi:hypothetical protein